MTEQLLTKELNSLNQKIEQAQNTFFSLLGAKREVEKLLDMLLKEKGEPAEEPQLEKEEEEGEHARYPD